MPDLYHVAPPEHRDSIAGHGLTRSLSHAGRHYLAADPHAMLADLAEGTQADFSRHDIWQVDARGLELHDDPESPGHWGAVYTTQPVGPGRLRRQADLMAHFGEYCPDPGWTFWHGTPDIRTWGHGAHYGIHVGTEEAARQALHAKIGEPAEGTWDGTREYGKTLLKGQRAGLQSGYNMERRPDHYPKPATYHEPVRQPGGGWGHGPPVSFEDREPGKVYNSRGAVYSDSSPVPMDARPSIFPVRITGPMTNHPATPHEDFKANGYMAGALKRGNAKRGYFYRNVGEDEGSISAVVPSAKHLERLDGPKTAGLLAHFALRTLYHGTDEEFGPGEVVEPGHESRRRDPGGKLIWMHEDPAESRSYGKHLYEVEPTGILYDDSGDGGRGSWSSTSPARVVRKVSLLEHFAAAGEGFPNPYHGTMPGGRPEFGSTWFHGTKWGAPRMSEGRPPVQRYSEHESWPQPNKMLGTHFSPLHSVAHGFAFPLHGSRWTDPPEPGRPSALVHAKLKFRDPAHFPTEDHLNLAIARWADRESPHWHNPEVNKFLAGSYQDTEGTHKDWHQEPRDLDHVHHLGNMAQHVMSWHPKLPEILHGFTQHLIDDGHHGITYGNQVEGPYSHVSAIATRPSQIETTHVEHIAAPDREPQEHEVRYSREGDINHTPGEEGAPAGQRASSDLNESDEFHEAIEKLHTGQGHGDFHTYPRPVKLYPGYREHREAAFSWLKSEFEEEPEEPDEREITKDTDWSQGWPGFPHEKRKKTAAAPAYDGPWYHGSAHRFKAGDLIEPGYHKAHDVSSKEHVYLAASESVARTFGGLAAVRNKAKTYGIYQVEPTGPTEPDPDGMGHRTQHPLRVVRLHERGSSPGDPNPWWNQPGTGKGYPKQAAVPGRAFDAEAEPGPFEPGTHPGPFLHGGPTRVEPGDVIRNDARPVEWGRLQHNFFTTSRAVAEDAADMRNGRGHGWIHTVEPTDSYERDYGEPDSFRSRAPLRVLSVDPGRLNGSTPHPPVVREAGVKAGSHGDDFTEASGYVGCDQGHEHWGPHGASFLLLRHRDPGDATQRYLLQKRTSTGATDHGGTWALPGGALQHEDEDSYAAARREAAEEMGPLPRMRHSHTVRDDHGGWFADTHVADVKSRFQPHGEAKTGYEAEGHAWFSKGEVDGLREQGALHPGFAASWDTVRRSRTDKTATRNWDRPGDLYLRFGDWHKSERSRNYVTGHPEEGVSVYDLDERGKPEDPDPGWDRGHAHDEHCEPDCDLDEANEEYGNDTREEMLGRVTRAERDRYHGEDQRSNTGHLVRGEVVGLGHDAEPLIRNVRRVGDWIDHRHLFIPGAEKHRLARDEHDEDYEPPEETPPHTAVLHPDPPDWAHGMQSGGSQVEWVRREKLQPYMEFRHDRETGQSHYLPTGHRFPDRYSKERWDEMDSSVAEKGMHEPILLEYNPWTRKMHIGEGHHRLESAERAGHEMVPVWGLKTSQEHAHARAVPGEPKVTPEHFEGGYFPSSFKPSDVLPEHWMKSRAEREQDEWLHPKNAARGEEPPERYYHGTNAELSPGDQVTTGHPATFGRDRQPMPHVYTTKSIGAARAYARSRSRLHGGEPHVYEVRPAPDVEPDPEGTSAGPHPYRASSLTVHRELSLDELRGNGKTAVITPGSLPPGQQAAFDAEDHREHRRRMLDVAKNPPPGTRVWRGEIRRNDEDPASAPSAGMHWSASPDPIITGWAPEGHKHVVWQGIVEHHDEQAFPRKHPIWSGRHESMDFEAEVRFRPGAHVKLEGAYVHEPKEYPGGLATTPGHLVPRFPERTHPDWKWHPLDRHIEIRHAGHGASDYSELGIPREAARTYRLWRGEGSHDEAPVSEGSKGRWFTPDRVTAEDYAYQNKGHLYRLDVSARDKEHIAGPGSVWKGITGGGPVAVLADEELAARKEHHAEGCPSCDPEHDETHRHQRAWLKNQGSRQLPVTEIGPLYHGTTDERAGRILEHGFEGGTVHLTPHADLAGRYAEGRVIKDQGGTPAVLKVDTVRGVSASETGYMDPVMSRESGADYQDKGPEVVVLNPAAIHGITRHAVAEPAMVL